MNEDRARKKLEELKTKRQNRQFWMAKSGENYIRVLPNWTGDLDADFYYETSYHKKLGANRDKQGVCLVAEGRESCPVCKTIRELWDSKDQENIDLAKEMKAQVRVYYNIVDLKDKPKGVQVMVSGVDVLEQLLSWSTNPKYGDVTHPTKGRNITLKMTDSKNSRSGYNEYEVQPDPDRTQIEDPNWLEKMVDLSLLVKPLTYDELDNLLWGREGSGVKQETPKEEKEKPKEEPPKEEAKEAPKEEPKPKPQPSQTPGTSEKPCFGKYDAEDPECQTCKKDEKCQVHKAELKAKAAALSAPPAANLSAAPESSGGGEKNINDVLAKIKNKGKVS